MRFTLPEDVRGRHLFLIGSVLPDLNSLFELLIAADGLKRGGAGVSLVLLYLAYARQDKPKPGEAFAAQIVCKMLDKAGFREAFVLDVHNVALREYFAFENILPLSIFKAVLAPVKDAVIVSPDEGGTERAKALADVMELGFASISKKRLGPGKSKTLDMKGDVRGKNAVIIDDMVDTGGTIIDAARLLKERGARDIYVGATHGVLSEGAVKRLEASPIRELIVTNSLPVKGPSKKIDVVNIEPLLESILAERP
jgi:ribose-phosphate pyrophosphokinase